MGASFKIDDADFQSWADRVKREATADKVRPVIEKSLANIGEQALRQLKANTPVDTGNLRRGWVSEGSSYGAGGWQVKLANNVEYAYFVENGHRTKGGSGWVPGQFFMKSSTETIKRQLPQLIDPALYVFRSMFE
ncbi:HK97 gp10 family phage protein [Lactobacillus delbrueckii]|uniref:HK97 gp10 family phage protein n=1 Tax=Lactobacillus delbrueckii TaxID=1584 RepID=UPI0025B05DB3|nr:HK97 gp10 family phage protein [Lactobacillus delbrueckii]